MDRRPGSARSRTLLESGIAIPGGTSLGIHPGRPNSRGASTPRPPTSASIPDSTRQGTSYRMRQENNNRLMTAAQGGERPMTGMGFSGTRRQIMDKSFFITELRTRRSDLHKEIGNLADEISALERDKATSSQLSKRQSTLEREVRKQQGQLADFNLAWDNIRLQKSPNKIKEEILEYQEKNAHQRQKIEVVFSDHNQNHSSMKEIEIKLAALQREKEKRLKELAPSKREEYSKLQIENESLKHEIAQLKNEDLKIDSEIEKLESQLKESGMREQALKLQEQLHQLQKERIDLEAEEASLTNNPERVRTTVVEKLRQDKADITAAEKHIRELEKAIAMYKSKLSSTKPVTDSDKNAQNLRVEKVQELKNREIEMQTYVDEFEERYRRATEEIENVQHTIVDLLEDSSRQLGLKATLPARSQFGAIKEELSYKQVQKDNAEITDKRLKLELRQRRSELEKIESLEEKIKVEIASLSTVQKRLEEETAKLSDIVALEREAEARQSQLHAEKKSLQEHLPIARLQVDEVAKKHHAQSAQAMESGAFKSIEKSELILQKILMNNFEKERFIKTSLHLNDQTAAIQECLGLVDELNRKTVKAIAT